MGFLQFAAIVIGISLTGFALNIRACLYLQRANIRLPAFARLGLAAR